MDTQEVGAYEAKTHLAAYLRAVQAGQRYTITQRGRPVAELLPYGASQLHTQVQAAQQMQAFVQSRPAEQPVDIKALIEQGRD